MASKRKRQGDAQPATTEEQAAHAVGAESGKVPVMYRFVDEPGAFDPDAFLRSTVAPAPTSEPASFDPDAFLAGVPETAAALAETPVRSHTYPAPNVQQMTPNIQTGEHPHDQRREVGVWESAGRSLKDAAYSVAELTNRGLSVMPAVVDAAGGVVGLDPRVRERWERTMIAPAQQERKEAQIDPTIERQGLPAQIASQTGPIVRDVAATLVTAGAALVPARAGAGVVKALAPAVRQGAGLMAVPSAVAGLDAQNAAREAGATEAEAIQAGLAAQARMTAAGALPLAVTSGAGNAAARFAERTAKAVPLVTGQNEAIRGVETLATGEGYEFDPQRAVVETLPMAVIAGAGGGRTNKADLDNGRPPDALSGSELLRDLSADAADSPGRSPDAGGDRATAPGDLRRRLEANAKFTEGTPERFGAEQSAIAQWANNQGRLIPDAELEKFQLVSNSTSEHEVRFDGATGRAIKRTWAGNYGQVPFRETDGSLGRRAATPQEYVNRIELQNSVFGDDQRIEGVNMSARPSMIIGRPAGEPSFVISQKWLTPKDAERPAPAGEEIAGYLTSRGFSPVPRSYYGWLRPEDGVAIVDAKPDNFIKTETGIAPIDLQMAKLAAKGDDPDPAGRRTDLPGTFGEASAPAPRSESQGNPDTAGTGAQGETGEAASGDVFGFGPGAAATGEFGPQKTTSTKNAVVDAERVKRGLQPRAPGTSVRLIPENKAAQWLFDNAKRLFTAEGDLPVETFQRWGERQGEVKEQSRETAYATRDLQAGLRQEFKIGKGEEFTEGFSKVPRAFVGQMNDALLGQVDINTLPETVRGPIHRMREHIDALSTTMLREGIIPEELQARVEGNLGVYMTRSYRVFDDVKWPKQVAPAVRNKASNFVLKELQRSNPAATPENARAVVESMLTDWTQQGTGALIKTGGKIGSKDLTSLIARKDIPEVIRQLMGEYKDPVINYTRSVTKMANLIGNSRFLNDVRQQGMGKWLFEDGSQPASHSALIAAEGSSVMGPLNGLRTTPEIAAAFSTFGKNNAITSAVAKLYFRINGIAKAGKTIGSVMTQVRNTVGQGYFWLMNGHFDVRPAGGAVRSIAADIGLTNSAKWRESYKRYLRPGLVDQSAKAGELRDVIKDAALNDINVPGLDVGGRTLESIRKIALDAPIKAYQVSDDLGRIVGFENELTRQKAINPTVDIATLERIAAERIQNTYPTYSRVPEWMKQARRQPVVGPFMTFAYESFRTAFHNLRYTAQDLASANPAQKKAGLQRLAGQIAVLGGGYVISATSRAMMGLTVEDEDDLRRFLPRWDKNAQLVFTGASDGKIEYINASFSNPYSYLTDPSMAVANGLRNDSELSTLIARSFGEFIRPFVSEDIMAAALIDVARNKTASGGRVYNPQDTPENILSDKMKRIREALEPGTATRLRTKIIPALKGEQTSYGTALDPSVEIMSEVTGLKRQSLDYEQALAFKARGFKRDEMETEAIFRKTALRRGNVSPGDISEAYQRSNSLRFALWKALYGDAKAAERRGVKRRAIKNSIESNGVTQTDVTAILSARYLPYEPKAVVNDRLRQLKRSLPIEVRQEIARSKKLMLSGEFQ